MILVGLTGGIGSGKSVVSSQLATHGAVIVDADVIVREGDIKHWIAWCDRLETMTSLAGFEALIRGKPVTCLGAPFYAGWGLTRDLGPLPDRRRYAADGHPLPRPELLHLALMARHRAYVCRL